MLEDEEPQCDWFTQRRLPDDITLKFDDGKELFASRGLLMCASTAFEAKFKHMKENVEDMSGRNYDHFLELLKCLHPSIAKPVTNDNVFYLADVAHDYDMEGLSKRCHDVFKIVLLHKGTLSEKDFQLSIPSRSETQAWLEVNNYNNCGRYHNQNVNPVNNILKVLSVAAKIRDKSLISEAINLLSHISVIHYDNIENGFGSPEEQEILKENKSMFYKLDVGLRARIYSARLYRIDIGKE